MANHDGGLNGGHYYAYVKNVNQNGIILMILM